MNSEIPVEILSLHPKLRLSLKFGSNADQFFAERSDSGKRYPLTEWQLELLMGMDGRQSFSSLIEKLESRLVNRLDAHSLRSFYTWLHTEELIATVTRTSGKKESVFELVMDEEEELEDEPKKVIRFSKMLVSNWDQAMTIACYAITILGVIRIAWVVAPAFDPLLQRAYADLAGFFQKNEDLSPVIASPSTVTAERTVQATKIEYISVAGKQDQMISLREQLAACRIRRDEYYLQNDESSYRTEVEMITRLARKIGELELTD